MSSWTIYHNPRCSKSRKVLEILESHGIRPVIIDYLKNPLGLAELVQLSAHFDLKDFVRDNEPIFEELKLTIDDKSKILTAMLQAPILMQRPIVTYGNEAIIARPPEKILNLLSRHENRLDRLRKNIINAYGQTGEQWYNSLSHTINTLQAHWSLTDIQPVPNMSWNYVAFAQQNANAVILKMSADAKSMHHEYQALDHFAGIGAVKIIDYSSKHDALLLQRALNGTLLKEELSKNISNVIHIYAHIVNQLRSDKTSIYPFQHVKEWCLVIDEIHDPRIPLDYVEKAKQIRSWIFQTITDEYVCHGDLHLENIVLDQKQWLAIDPKGVIGEIAFEAAAFDLLDEHENKSPKATSILKDRFHQLATALNIDTIRLTAWIFLKIMIAVQWFIEDKGDPSKMLSLAKNIYPLLQSSYL